MRTASTPYGCSRPRSARSPKRWSSPWRPCAPWASSTSQASFATTPTRAVCETVATGSTLFVTKDDPTMVAPAINAWIAHHAGHWGISDAPAVVDVEDAMVRWGQQDPRGLAEIALLAYWAEDRNAFDEAAIRQTLACLRSIAAGGTPVLAGFAIAQVGTFASDRDWMQTLRDNSVTRTREAERRHPRRDENQPAELAIRDPGATPCRGARWTGPRCSSYRGCGGSVAA